MPTLSEAIAKARQAELRREAEHQRLARQARLARSRTSGDRPWPGRLATAVLSAATARAGEQLGLAPLGRLVEGAPADLIGVRGNPLEHDRIHVRPSVRSSRESEVGSVDRG
jgi:cytosine/adenosine deaminase-related metal-dependent hydrolase